jgi:hypothetical protein
MTTISLANDFSPFPGGRFRSDGPFSGEVFRDDILLPKLREAIDSGEPLILVLDGVAGLPSSFLEEGFGGILRIAPEMTAKNILLNLRFEFQNPLFKRYESMISDYVSRAERAKTGV